MSGTSSSPKDSGPVMLKGSDLVLGLAALVAEIVLFAGVIFLVRELGGGAGTGTILAGVAVILTGVLWAIFMSPKGVRRLSTPRRVLVVAALALAAGVGLIMIGEARWGYIVLAAGVVLSVLQWQIGERSTPPDPRLDRRTDSRPAVAEPRDE